MMENKSRRLAFPKKELDMDTDNWRAHLPPDSRQKIVNNIMEKLMKHLPFYGAEGVNEARTIAVTFEDDIFRGAVDQTDYLQKISMKMMTMEAEWQNAAGSSSFSLSIPEASKKQPLNPGHVMDNVDSKPSLPRAEAAVNICGLTTQLPSDSRPNNANTTYISIQSITGLSLPRGEPAMTTYDWRTQLNAGSRERIVNKITEMLQKHIPSPELRRIAAKFEEKIFSSAVNQNGYLRSIAIKMLTMETKYQTTAGSSSSLPIPSVYSSLPLNPGCNKMTIQGPMNTGDWRTCLPPDSRKKNVNKIKGSLKKHVPNCGKEGKKELKKIATSFEELIFNTAIDQVDYLRKISFKMQTMN